MASELEKTLLKVLPWIKPWIHQLRMVTSGLIKSDRIVSPFGMSFVSARWMAASYEVSIPAARWRVASRSFTISGGTSTNHLHCISHIQLSQVKDIIQTFRRRP